MAKQKKKLAPSKRYMEVLDKFGLLPNFDFTKKEKKVVKLLGKNGDIDAISIGDELDLKPEKVRKIIDRLVEKGVVEVDGSMVRLSPLGIKYVHTEKQERKNAKKFYEFIDTLSEKELEEFQNLVSSFEVNPYAPVDEETKEEENPAEPAPVVKEEEPKIEEEAKAEEVVSEAKADEKPVLKPRSPKTRKPRASKPRAKKEPVKEPKPEEETPAGE